MTDVRSPDVALPTQRKARGWVLLTTAWILRIAGALAFIAGVQGSRTSSNRTHDLGYSGPPWIALLFIYIGVMVAGLVVFSISLAIGRRARLHLKTIVPDVSVLAPGSYVLYLRPFTQDLTSAAMAQGSTSMNSFAPVFRSGRTHEERLGRTFREFGPLIAVGRPGEPLPGGSGARRTYLPLDDWKDTVRELIDNARLVILGAGPGPGTVWEYVEILRRRDPSRLVILVTNPEDYLRFKASSVAEAEGVLYELKARHGDLWQPPILPELPPAVNPKVNRAFYFRAMVYFGAGWEPQLAYFDRSALKDGASALKVSRHFMQTLRPVMDSVRGGVSR